MFESGFIEIWRKNKAGLMVCEYHQHNDILDAAKLQFADLIREHPLSSPIRAFALGSNGTATTGAETTLGAEVVREVIPAAGTDTATEKNILTGSTIEFRQTFGPGLTFTLRELGLFGDLIALSNPTVAPEATAVQTGGTLTAGTYTVVYTWKNNNGETEVSPSDTAVITSSVGKIDVVIPALPLGATLASIYAGTGTPALSGTTATATYTISAPPAGGAAPGTNTTVLPGIANSGRLINRAVIADHAYISTDVFTVRSVLILS